MTGVSALASCVPGKPILIVDDYADARAELREMLEEMGHDVVEAGDGQEALDFLLQEPDVRVQLILLDLDMPRMSGWDLLKLLKSYVRLSSIPVVVVSRHASSMAGVDARLMNGWLQAPYEIPRLKAIVEALVSH